MKRVVKWTREIVQAVAVAACVLFLLPRGCDMVLYKHLVPPSSVQTFDDFLEWQIPVEYCYEVNLRGVTYYHVIGPDARTLPSGGALYVFDAKGNYIGWSRDVGDVMRKEAVFYPHFWLSEGDYSTTEITLDDLKERLQSNAAEPDSSQLPGATPETRE